ncbi:hypothetical protein [Lysinibacter sp. HNR]|uniref:hypothetical protein n=1 Tax=Lysinibacter sp. HNR TaxID=3031408 RepID=UPI0024349FF7|nr:hypothetical protein [Lysinibacter sp. HNR]WGD38469.1 hypothetical protein FrondiHNR_06050 [Lysinibacter sp. HNR]
MGYNPATTDPFDDLRRGREAAALATREALAAGGTRSFQAVAKLQAQMKELEQLFLSLPWAVTDFAQNRAYALGADWATVAVARITRPAGKNRVSIMAIASGSAVNTKEFSFPRVRSRIVIAGSAGLESFASTTYSVASDAHVCTSSHGLSIANPPQVIEVHFQMWTDGTGIFPASSDNVSQVTAQAIFMRE